VDNPRSEKVAVVDEVRQRFDDSNAAILTDYRGLKVKELAALRRSLRSNGGEYKIYKNTLVRLAARSSGLASLEDMLLGPTGIAFVDGDAAAVAKVLRDYARTNPLLVIKGGVLGDQILGASETAALADLPPLEVLLARFAGALAAPMQQMAGLLQALPRNLAYGLAALRDLRAAAEPATDTPSAEAAFPAEAASSAEAASTAEAASSAEAASTAEAGVPTGEAAEADVPAVDADVPAAEIDVPAAEGEGAAVGAAASPDESEVPAAETEVPSVEDESPAVEAEATPEPDPSAEQPQE